MRHASLRPSVFSLLGSGALHGVLLLILSSPFNPPTSHPQEPIPILPLMPKTQPLSPLTPQPVTPTSQHERNMKRAAPKLAPADPACACASPSATPSLLPVATTSQIADVAAPAVSSVSEAVPAPLEAPAVPAVDTVEATRAYARALTELIESRLEYPLQARKFRWEGRCLIRCQLKGSGVIEQAQVIRPSEHELLDNAALRAIQRIDSFPPVPESLEGSDVAIEVPITFRMQD